MIINFFYLNKIKIKILKPLIVTILFFTQYQYMFYLLSTTVVFNVFVLTKIVFLDNFVSVKQL